MNQERNNILVIDDDPGIRQMMQDVLEIYGYNVLTACDGGQGISTLTSMKHPPSVIVLDLMMPGLNGWDFLDFQRNNPQYADVPVVICSAYGESAKSVRAQKVLVKPVKLDSLVGAVRTYCV
ncbi:MAG TPA: response regulator [Bacteriovoracaceae bacterium]|nr:response regulator [Bacteriovoracaceae bacterium]